MTTTSLKPSTAIEQPYFKYEPLANSRSETRLLTLLPGSGKDVISCEMRNVPRPIEEKYDALSYEWGDQANPKEILVNGVVFLVGQSLAAFLSQVRSQFRKRLPLKLWVDAVCIDQNHFSEKGHQVKRMYEIFSRAKSVLSWLGEVHDDAELWFEHLKDVWNNLPEDCLCSARKPEDCQKLFKTLFDGEEGARLWLSAKRVYLRPYFARTWVVPELIHAQEVVLFLGKFHLAPGGFELLHQVSFMEEILLCGEYSFPRKGDDLDRDKLMKAGCSDLDAWALSELGIFQFPQSNILSESPGHAVCRIRQLKLCEHCEKRPTNENFVSLDRLLDKFGQTSCSDARDSIFALLSITRPTNVDSHWLFEDLDTSYNQSLLEVVLLAGCRLPRLNVHAIHPFIRLLGERSPPRLEPTLYGGYVSRRLPHFREISREAALLAPHGTGKLQARYIGQLGSELARFCVGQLNLFTLGNISDGSIHITNAADSIYVTDAIDRLQEDHYLFHFSGTTFFGIYELVQGQLRYLAGAFRDEQRLGEIHPTYTEQDDYFERLACLQGLESQLSPRELTLRRVECRSLLYGLYELYGLAVLEFSFEVDVSFLQLLAAVLDAELDQTELDQNINWYTNLISELFSIGHSEIQTLGKMVTLSSAAIKIRQEGDYWKLVDAPTGETLGESLRNYNTSTMSSPQRGQKQKTSAQTTTKLLKRETATLSSMPKKRRKSRKQTKEEFGTVEQH